MATILTYTQLIQRFQKALDSATERFCQQNDQERLVQIQRAIAAGVQAASAGLNGAEMVPAEELKRQVAERVKEINSAYDAYEAPHQNEDDSQDVVNEDEEADDDDDEEEEEEEEVIRKASKQAEETLRALRAAKRETLHTLGSHHGKVYERVLRNYDATIQAVQDGETSLSHKELQEILDKQFAEDLKRYGTDQQTSVQTAAASPEQPVRRHGHKHSVVAAKTPTAFSNRCQYTPSSRSSTPDPKKLVPVKEAKNPASQPLAPHAYKRLVTAPELPPFSDNQRKRLRSPGSSRTTATIPKKRYRETEQPAPPETSPIIDMLPLPSLVSLTRNEAFFRGYDYIIQSVLNETAEDAHPEFKEHFKIVRNHALHHFGLTVDRDGKAIEYRNARIESGTQTEDVMHEDTSFAAASPLEKPQSVIISSVSENSITRQIVRTPSFAATPEAAGLVRPGAPIVQRSSSQTRISIIRRFPTPEFISNFQSPDSNSAASPETREEASRSTTVGDGDTNPYTKDALRDQAALTSIDRTLREVVTGASTSNQVRSPHDGGIAREEGNGGL